jgi:hypothetical protein
MIEHGVACATDRPYLAARIHEDGPLPSRAASVHGVEIASEETGLGVGVEVWRDHGRTAVISRQTSRKSATAVLA